MRFYNPFNKSLVGLLTLLFVLWIINDLDDAFEKEACSQYRPPVRPPPPPPPAALADDMIHDMTS